MRYAVDNETKPNTFVPSIKVTKSRNNMPAIEINDASPAMHEIVRNILSCQHVDDYRYQLTKRCGAFFQSGSDRTSGFILIEFWQEQGHEEFAAYLSGACYGFNVHAMLVDAGSEEDCGAAK